jgi:citrate synthase
MSISQRNVMRAMGIPNSMFTAFAPARTAGWIAQWFEMNADPEHKIGPSTAFEHTGEARREFVPMDVLICVWLMNE